MGLNRGVRYQLLASILKQLIDYFCAKGQIDFVCLVVTRHIFSLNLKGDDIPPRILVDSPPPPQSASAAAGTFLPKETLAKLQKTYDRTLSMDDAELEALELEDQYNADSPVPGGTTQGQFLKSTTLHS